MIRIPGVSEEQEYRILRETVASYASKVLAPQAEQFDLDPSSGTLRDALSRAGDMGMLAAMVPEKYGGGGLDAYAFCVALEEIAKEEAGVAANLLIHNAALMPFSLAESEGASPAMEPGAYPVCLAFPGEISLSGGSVRGRAPFAFNALDCPLMTLLPSGGAGTQAVTVVGGSAGVDITPDPYQMGLRAARAGSLDFSGAEASQVVTGGNIVEAVERLLFLGMASIATGITRKSLEKAYGYAVERYQAGKMIIEHQQMRIFLAEMLAAVEQSRALVKRACDVDEAAPALVAWIRATDSACKAAIDGVQVHGGYGYMRDYGMERLMRDSKYCQMYPITGQEALLRLLELSESG